MAVLIPNYFQDNFKLIKKVCHENLDIYGDTNEAVYYYCFFNFPPVVIILPFCENFLLFQ